MHTGKDEVTHTGYMSKDMIDTTYNAEKEWELFFTFDSSRNCLNLEDTNDPSVRILHLCLNRYFDSQTESNKNSYWPYSHIYPSTTYSKKTMKLVEEFQRMENLHVDGLAGNQTLQHLAEWIIRDNRSR